MFARNVFLTDTFNSDSSGEESNEKFLTVSKDFDRHSHSGGSMESLDSDTVNLDEINQRRENRLRNAHDATEEFSYVPGFSCRFHSEVYSGMESSVCGIVVCILLASNFFTQKP